ncbi:MAG: hypothetical protein JWP89_2274 [Schlesneria sp.]|nr:hypothetical protein [Schlesneria sp.]
MSDPLLSAVTDAQGHSNFRFGFEAMLVWNQESSLSINNARWRFVAIAPRMRYFGNTHLRWLNLSAFISGMYYAVHEDFVTAAIIRLRCEHEIATLLTVIAVGIR